MSLLLTALAVVVVALRADRMPRVVDVWPLALAVGVSIVAWWLQGVISALLARPRLGDFRVKAMLRIYLAGAFIGGISPIRGAEIPYEVYMLRRLGLSAGEGSTVVVSRGLINVAVVTIGSLCGLAFAYDSLPEVGSWKLIGAALLLGGCWALAIFLLRRRRSGTESAGADARSERKPTWREQISRFLRDMWESFVLLWRRDQRKILIYSLILMIVYWAFRLSFGPLALMAAGWSGDWTQVVLAQLFLTSFVLPFAPTPGGSGATELGFAGFLAAYTTHGELVSGVVIYAGLTHYLPTIVGAFYAGRQLWQVLGARENDARHHHVRLPEED